MLSGAMPIQAQSTCTIGNLTYKNDLLYTLGFGCTPLTSITFGKLNTNQFDVASPTFLTAADIRTANFPFLDVRNYGLVGDGTQLTTCSIMANTNAVHCTTSNFTAADVNKMAVFLGAGGSGEIFLPTSRVSRTPTTLPWTRLREHPQVHISTMAQTISPLGVTQS
jgi:hypothetical protein